MRYKFEAFHYRAPSNQFSVEHPMQKPESAYNGIEPVSEIRRTIEGDANRAGKIHLDTGSRVKRLMKWCSDGGVGNALNCTGCPIAGIRQSAVGIIVKHLRGYLLSGLS